MHVSVSLFSGGSQDQIRGLLLPMLLSLQKCFLMPVRWPSTRDGSWWTQDVFEHTYARLCTSFPDHCCYCSLVPMSHPQKTNVGVRLERCAAICPTSLHARTLAAERVVVPAIAASDERQGAEARVRVRRTVQPRRMQQLPEESRPAERRQGCEGPKRDRQKEQDAQLGLRAHGADMAVGEEQKRVHAHRFGCAAGYNGGPE